MDNEETNKKSKLDDGFLTVDEEVELAEAISVYEEDNYECE